MQGEEASSLKLSNIRSWKKENTFIGKDKVAVT